MAEWTYWETHRILAVWLYIPTATRKDVAAIGVNTINVQLIDDGESTVKKARCKGWSYLSIPQTRSVGDMMLLLSGSVHATRVHGPCSRAKGHGLWTWVSKNDTHVHGSWTRAVHTGRAHGCHFWHPCSRTARGHGRRFEHQRPVNTARERGYFVPSFSRRQPAVLESSRRSVDRFISLIYFLLASFQSNHFNQILPYKSAIVVVRKLVCCVLKRTDAVISQYTWVS